MLRALASHRCGSGSILGLDAIFGSSLLLVLFSALRGFSVGTPVSPRELWFSPLLKNQHFQILIRSRFQWTNSHSVEVPLQIPIISNRGIARLLVLCFGTMESILNGTHVGTPGSRKLFTRTSTQ